MVRAEGLTTTAQVVDYFLLRFMSVPLGAAERQMLIDFLDQQLGTSDIVRADSYLEDPLRMLDAPDHEPARVSARLSAAIRCPAGRQPR